MRLEGGRQLLLNIEKAITFVSISYDVAGSVRLFGELGVVAVSAVVKSVSSSKAISQLVMSSVEVSETVNVRREGNRPVDEVQIDVVGAELLQAQVDGSERITVLGAPELRSDEEVLAVSRAVESQLLFSRPEPKESSPVDAGLLYSFSNFILIRIYPRRAVVNVSRALYMIGKHSLDVLVAVLKRDLDGIRDLSGWTQTVRKLPDWCT